MAVSANLSVDRARPGRVYGMSCFPISLYKYKQIQMQLYMHRLPQIDGALHNHSVSVAVSMKYRRQNTSSIDAHLHVTLAKQHILPTSISSYTPDVHSYRTLRSCSTDYVK